MVKVHRLRIQGQRIRMSGARQPFLLGPPRDRKMEGFIFLSLIFLSEVSGARADGRTGQEMPIVAGWTF